MGRNAEFQRDKVIGAATEVFWEHGFHASTMSELKHAMGLNPGSIYSTFGSKEGLFSACLERYSLAARAKFEKIENSSATARDAFLKIFDSIIDQVESGEISRGCFLINTLLETSSKEDSGAQAAQAYLERNKEIFVRILEKAKTNRELDSGRPVDDLAAFLFGTIFSLRVMGKANADRDTLEAIRDQALDQVFG